jgi:Tfp pilus assembly protein PilO
MTPANKNYLGVGLIGLTMIVFWIFGMPAWDRISLLNDAIAEREDILSSRTEILRKIEDLNKQYQQRTADVSKISSVVPNTKSAAEIVSTIEAITQQTGMQLIEIIMSSSGNQQQEFQTVFIELGLVGSYPSLTTFLELMEKNLRLIDVAELSASQAPALGQQIVLNFRVKANAYYLKVGP